VTSRATKSSSDPVSIRLEVDASFRRIVELAATARDLTIGQYVLEAIEDRLRDESDDTSESNDVLGAADPVLVELWDNPRDAEYDRL